jgi:hypothetical protein
VAEWLTEGSALFSDVLLSEKLDIRSGFAGPFASF